MAASSSTIRAGLQHPPPAHPRVPHHQCAAVLQAGRQCSAEALHLRGALVWSVQEGCQVKDGQLGTEGVGLHAWLHNRVRGVADS